MLEPDKGYEDFIDCLYGTEFHGTEHYQPKYSLRSPSSRSCSGHCSSPPWGQGVVDRLLLGIAPTRLRLPWTRGVGGSSTPSTRSTIPVVHCAHRSRRRPLPRPRPRPSPLRPKWPVCASAYGLQNGTPATPYHPDQARPICRLRGASSPRRRCKVSTPCGD